MRSREIASRFFFAMLIAGLLPGQPGGARQTSPQGQPTANPLVETVTREPLASPQPVLPQVAGQSPVPPAAQVTRGKNEADGKRWTTVSIPAATLYQAWLSTVRPQLLVVCEEGRNAFVLFKTGPLQTRPGPRGHFYARSRVTLDDGEPAGYDLFERSAETYQPIDAAGLSTILKSKRVVIEFQPRMVAGPVVAEFDASGLSKEFGKYPECQAPEAPDPVPPAGIGKVQ
jgi:hypothetical protein